ncbi:Small-conductance mechanosensitive channel [Rubripirellula lacrimiformis]|uniref:Small-conductance mechanosensitive channel n=1 Tax=Rubripirellula lacrimiformis TaxID=1930273 RepID=A0A517NKY8_9BACT|nr:mechanosensitive ion channel domain-containing protein [Rubripirellula lacrimiformis]QDT07739.1 Small-conductance mechanosensitive channel [Rubripirellula lacrimiformis]
MPFRCPPVDSRPTNGAGTQRWAKRRSATIQSVAIAWATTAAICIGFAPPLVYGQAATDASAETTTTEPAQAVSVENVTDDAEITDRVTRILKSTPWFKDVKVETDNGVVTVHGVADTAEHRDWAIALVNRTEDAVATVDAMSIDPTVDLQASASVVERSLYELWRDFLLRLPLLIASLVFLVITAVLAKIISSVVRRVLNKRRMRTGLKDLLDQLTTIAIWIIGILIATVIAFPGMTPSKALTVLGLGSVAIGFAFKDIFENFFAGILILLRYPFDRGDFITCNGLTGCVQEITIRNTMIRRLDGELTIIPNAQLFKSNVDVLTNQDQRRMRLICGVAYDEDVDQARDVISDAVRKCQAVDSDRTIEVFAMEFADSSINFEVTWWTGSLPADLRRSRDQVVASIKRALDQAGIEIPFPYRTLTFKDPNLTASVLGPPPQLEQK